MKRISCYMFSLTYRQIKNVALWVVIILSILPAVIVAQIPDAIKMGISMPLTDEEQIRMILDDIEQGVRCNQVLRITRWFGKQSTQSSKQTQLFEAFKYGESKISNKTVSFCMDSIQVIVSGDSAVVKCLIGNRNEQKNLITASLNKELGRWVFKNDNNFDIKISDFVRSNGFAASDHFKKSHTKSSGKMQNSAQSTGINIIESNHLFIPYLCYENPKKWFITRTDAVQNYQNDIFETLTEIEFMPIATSGQTLTQSAMFVLDQRHNRIIFARQGGNWIKSYGDWPGEYSFYDIRGMRVVKMGDGTINLFVTDATKGEIVHLRYNHDTGTITFFRSIKISSMIPVDVDINAMEAHYFPSSYTIYVADKGRKAVLELDKDGNLTRTITNYTYNGVAYPLDNVTKINYSYPSGVISLIDRNQMAFVTMNYLGDASSMTKFDSPSNLSNISEVHGNAWIVSDENLNMVHYFSEFGYLGSFKIYNSSNSVNPSFFSDISGTSLFNRPISFSGGGQSNNYDISLLTLWSGNVFLNNSGFGRLLPGADILNFTATNTPNNIIYFDYTIAGCSVFNAKIYNSANVVVATIASNQTVYSGRRSDQFFYTSLGGTLGTYKLKLSVIPQSNSQFAGYEQNPIEKIYDFAAPINGNLTGPTSGFSGNNLIWNMNVTSGSGNFEYFWSRQDFGNAGWNYLSTSNVPSISQQVGNKSFTIQCEVHDLSNDTYKIFNQYVSSITTSGSLISNEIWSGTVNLTGAVTVPNGLTLTLQPGTIVKFPSGASLIANGKLIANGASFLPINGSTPGSWGSITLNGAGASGSSLNGVTMQYGYAVVCNPEAANITINNCTIQNNQYGILCYSSSPIISNNQILYNTYAGIQNTMNANPHIENNTITNIGRANNSIGVYLYGGQGYINLNTISGFHVGVYPRAGSSLGAWSGDDYYSTPTQNNKITGNTYGVITYDNSWAFMGIYDEEYGTVHGGNNWIENNVGYDLVASDNTGLYAQENWYGADYVPTYVQGANPYVFAWWALFENPWGGYASSAINQKRLLPLSKKITGAVPNSKTSEFYKNVKGEDKLFQDAISDHMKKSYGNAQNKYKKLLSSKKYSQSALVLLSRLFMESNDDNGLINFEDLKSNPSKNKLDPGNLSLTTNLLANMQGNKGNYDKSFALYDNVIKNYPNTIEERNARVQKIYYAIEGKKDQAGAQQMLNDLLAIYKDGDDIEMIKNLVDHAVLSSGESSKQFSKESKIVKEPTEYSLAQNFPNPFNPSTTIKYALPKAGNVVLKVYDVLGKEVATLVNDFKETGRYQVEFDASKLSSGMYIYKLTSDKFTEVKKMMLVK